jgi:hypothetical protein
MLSIADSNRVGMARWAGRGDPIMAQLGAAANSSAGLARVAAAADFFGNGAIEVNLYEREILDMVRREGVLRQRIQARRATGHPHRYIEQLLIGLGGFTDPRNLTPTPSGPSRVERSVLIKALVNQINLTLFDVQVTQQQGIFDNLESRDIQDCVNGIIVEAASAYWTGTDTSLTTATTDQYVGLLTQITQQSTVLPGSSMVDGIKYAVAQMMANTTFKVRPTAIYMNPILSHYLDTEAKATNITMGSQVVAGVTVKNVDTQAGPLPIITDVYLPASSVSAYGFASPTSGYKNYFAAILTEDMIERPYISGQTQNPDPQLYRLGLPSSLSGQYVAVQFDAIVAKGASYAHALVAIQRI